jgi:hypothetical protein
MNKLDNYIKLKKCLYSDKINEKYSIFGYDDEDDLQLDLQLLLAVKYKHIKYYEDKEQRAKYKKLKSKVKNENCNQKTIDKYNKLKSDIKSIKYYFEPDSNDNLIKYHY